MLKSVVFVFLSALVYCTQPNVLHGEGTAGSVCEMGGTPGVMGTCMDIQEAMNHNGEFKRGGEIKLCGQPKEGGPILVCVRNATIVAQQICDLWKPLWSPATGQCAEENPLIFGGTAAQVGEFPYIARIGLQSPGAEIIDWEFCGGTLISPHFVLSAAHCFNCRYITDTERCKTWDQDAQYWIRLGDHDEKIEKTPIDRIRLKNPYPTMIYQSQALNEDTSRAKVSTEQEIKVKRFLKYPEYDSTFRYYDIALVELETPAIFTRRVLPACLQYKYRVNPVKKDEHIGLINQTIHVAGWGITEDDSKPSSPILKKTQLNATQLLLCYPDYPAEDRIPLGLVPGHLCVNGDDEENLEPVAGTCNGDGGGPAVYKPKGVCEPLLVGVISFGKACGTGNEMYTRVLSYLNWIISYIAPNP